MSAVKKAYWCNLTLILTIGLFLVPGAHAQELVVVNKGGGLACFTEEAHDELIDALVANNWAWAGTLVEEQKCFQMVDGLKATVKDYSMFGASEIYLHPPGGGRPIAVFTVNENFQLK